MTEARHSIDAQPVEQSAAPSPIPPARRKSGAPKGNANRTAHGLHGSGLPKGCVRLCRRINEFRRALVAAMEERAGVGKIDLHTAATIDSACQWQRHALLAARWLRLQHDELSPDQRLAFSREVAKASTERDRCIRLMGLDAKFDPAEAVWADFDRRQVVRIASEVADAADAKSIRQADVPARPAPPVSPDETAPSNAI